jgi:hypothetical protein
MECCEYDTMGRITAPYFLLNLQLGRISYSVTLHQMKRFSNDKHSRLLGPFISYKENEVL